MFIGSEFKSDVTKLLKNIMLITEEQQQNTSIPTKSLWRPLTRSWQKGCFKSMNMLEPQDPKNVSAIWVKI